MCSWVLCMTYGPATRMCCDSKFLNLDEKVIVMNNPTRSTFMINFMDVTLTHWDRVTHICVSKLNIIGSYNGLSPRRCHTIIWTNAGILLIQPLGTKFSEILITIHMFSFMKMHLKMSSAKLRPFRLGLNVLKIGCGMRLLSLFDGCVWHHD